MLTLVRLLEQAAQHPIYLIKAFLALKSSGRGRLLLDSCSGSSSREQALVLNLEIVDATDARVLAPLRMDPLEEQSVTDGSEPIGRPR
jgi:hypothetical protein